LPPRTISKPTQKNKTVAEGGKPPSATAISEPPA
jgi:hypothetical protein